MRTIWALSGAIASVGIGIGAWAAPPLESNLVVVGEGTLEFDEDTMSADFTVCNQARPTARLKPRVISEDKVTDDLQVTSKTGFVLVGGTCRAFTVTVVGTALAELKPGTVVLQSKRGVVQVPYAATAAITPVFAEALGPTEFHARTGIKAPGGPTLDKGLLALRFDADVTEPVADQTIQLSDGEHLLTVDGEQQSASGNVAIYRLSLHEETAAEAPEPGNYKGALVLGKDKSVPVTVEVDDSAWWFAFWLGVFVLAGAVLKYWTDRLRITSRLARQRDRLPGLYGPVAVPSWPSYEPPTFTLVEKWQRENYKAQRDYFKTVITPVVTDPAYVKVFESIRDAQTDATIFRTELRGSLDQLKATSTAVDEWRKEVRESSSSPQIWTMDNGITAVLNRPSKPLAVGESTKMKARADELVTIAKTWRKQAEEVIRLAHWLSAVRKTVPDMDKKKHQLRRDALEDARLNLVEAWVRLSRATTVASIETAVADNLRRAFDLLVVAAGSDDAGPPDGPVRGPADAAFAPAQAKPEIVQPQREGDADPQPSLTGYGDDWAYLRTSRAWGRWLTDLLPLLFTTLIAFFTMFATTKLAVYDTQPFFSWTSFVAIAVAGLAATAVVDALFKALGWMRGGLAAVIAK